MLSLLKSLFIVAALLGASANAADCRGDLTSRRIQQSVETDGPLAPFFFKDPKLFYNDGGSRPQANSFFASNEADFHNTPWDTEATDVMVGFGTNSAWDLAVRKNPKLFIIGDYAAGPLIVQRFLQSTFLKLARTPAEYVLMIAGLQSPEGRLNDSLAQAEDYMMSLGNHYGMIAQNDMREIITRCLKANFSRQEVAAVGAYYQAQLFGTLPGQFGLMRGRIAHMVGNLLPFIAGRYLPSQQLKYGASPELISKPDYSFLSSQKSFDLFKKINEGAQYAHTDYMDEAFYKKLKAAGDAKGYRTYTFSVTNIMDANGHSKPEAIAELERFRTMIYKLFPEGKYEVIIFATTNFRPPHGFLRLERKSVIQAAQWLRAAS